MNFGQGKVSEKSGISFQTKSGHPDHALFTKLSRT